MQLQVVGGRARARTGRAPAWPCSPWTSRTLSPLNRHLLPGHPHPFTSKRSDRLNTRRSMASTKVCAALGGILSSEQATDAPPPRISPRRRPAPPSLAFPLVRARPLSVRVPFSPRLAVGSSPLSFASPRCCWCTVQATFLKEYKLVVVGGGGASPVPCLDLVLVQTSSNAFVWTIRLTSSAFVH
jgi:hypothetical protein